MAAALCLAVVYGNYDANMGYHIISLAEAVAFNGLFRVVWSIGVGCVILSCALGYGGKKVIFSHKNAFQVLNIVDRRKVCLGSVRTVSPT